MTFNIPSYEVFTRESEKAALRMVKLKTVMTWQKIAITVDGWTSCK